MQFNRCLGCMEEIQGYPCPHCGFDPRKAPASNYVMPWGTVLNGHYVVGRVLGQGGFGITYIGFDLNLERKVAIKEYFPSGQVSRFSTMGTTLVWRDGEQAEKLRVSGMDSFLREARKMANMEDIPQIVRVRESFRENNTAYIVMDYIEGKTLLSVLKEKGPMPWEQAKDIFFPAISAMEQVHREGLVHRDLSPDNLMLTAKGVRILDLGAAKDLSSSNGASSAQVAKSGFSPFEQYTQRGASGPWSDVYAMAATIYYTLTGVIPPNANDRVEEDTLDWSLLTRRGVPANVISALQKAMNITAKGRTQSMAELLDQLQSPVSAKKELTKNLLEQVVSGNKNRRPILIGAVALVLVLSGIALGLGVGQREDKPVVAQEERSESSHSGQADVPADVPAALPAETGETHPISASPVSTDPGDVVAKVNVMVQPEDLYGLKTREEFWGQSRYKRSDVKTMTFRDSLRGAPADAEDVSQAHDRSVLIWMEGSALYIAADGIISPNADASWMFGYFTELTDIDFGGCFDTSGVTNMRDMFTNCTSMTELDLSCFDTSNVTNMYIMFYKCYNLKRVNVSGFDTSRVTNMNGMFEECKSLEELDVSGFDSSNVTDMGGMFSGCTKLTNFKCSDSRIRAAYNQR